jgi:hypothetical protein
MLALSPFAYDLEHLDRTLFSEVVDQSLTADEVRFIERRCAAFMRRHGYAPYDERRPSAAAAA